ncbi:MAG TPA: DUF4097 family beta strand repeat-containing protein [Chloroflexota bacterium]|nr:DUF4097 family beta strand repeat-containing protein [Chloroflexota bacterium]
MEAAAPSAPAYQPAPVEPVPPGRRGHGGVVGGLILIALGITFLFGTWFPAGGAWLFVGLGTAFLVARVVTGRYGYAVPAGILLGFGGFVWLSETGFLNGPGAGGFFFVFLGLGFLASYAIAGRPQAVWPVLPGMLLIGFGAFVQATMFGVPFAQYWWLAQYWPLSLIAIGVWVLVRNEIPAAARTPLAIVGASALVLIGLLVAAAGVATVTGPYSRGPMSLPMPWPMVQMPFGTPPLQDNLALSAPAAGLTSVRVVNTSGSTVVRATEGSTVNVQATRHFWSADRAPAVQLVPSNGVLVVDATPVGVGTADGTYIDYVIETPSVLGADIRSASGSIELSGLGGPVRIATASGSVDARDLQGSTVISTASGGIRMGNISGDLQVTSVSGGIAGAGVDRVSDAHSTSGAINLTGDFATNAQVGTVSGAVTLRLTPAASVHIDATSVSGDVNAADLGLTSQLTGPHTLSGNIASGGPTLSIHTTSGSIRLLRGV